MRRAAIALALVGPAILAAGCLRVDLGLPETLPEKKYETTHAVAASVPRDQALKRLGEVLARCRMPNGQRMKPTLGPARFQYAWRFILPMSPTETHSYDFAYAEVTPKIVDLSSMGGRVGVKFVQGGVDVAYGYVNVGSVEDAETILDCFAVLAKPAG